MKNKGLFIFENLGCAKHCKNMHAAKYMYCTVMYKSSKEEKRHLTQKLLFCMQRNERVGTKFNCPFKMSKKKYSDLDLLAWK